MKPFSYVSPSSLDELFAVLRRHGGTAKLLAGGTDLVVRLRKGLDAPAVVVDLKRVGELRAGVWDEAGSVVVGARTVIADVLADPRVVRHFPALVEAAAVVGSVQIRNRATLAGNLCNASPAADTAPALLAYRARVRTVSDAGRREMPLDAFFAGPGRHVLAGGEIVESIAIPKPAQPSGGAFERLTRRMGVDLAIASVCCVVPQSGPVMFAFGAVGPRPFAIEASRDADLVSLTAAAAPISDLRGSADYRRAMLPVLARRALARAVRALGTDP